jgi:hypothetical protein
VTHRFLGRDAGPKSPMMDDSPSLVPIFLLAIVGVGVSPNCFGHPGIYYSVISLSRPVNRNDDY